MCFIGGSEAINPAAFFNFLFFIPNSYIHFLDLQMSASGVSGKICFFPWPPPSPTRTAPPPLLCPGFSFLYLVYIFLTYPQEICFSLFCLIITISSQLCCFGCYTFFPFCIHFLSWESRGDKSNRFSSSS